VHAHSLYIFSNGTTTTTVITTSPSAPIPSTTYITTTATATIITPATTMFTITSTTTITSEDEALQRLHQARPPGKEGRTWTALAKDIEGRSGNDRETMSR
jgi:hypothetical protein